MRAKQAILHSLKWPKIGNFDEFFEIEVCGGQIVIPDRSISIGQKLVENAKIDNMRMRHFESFSNDVDRLANDEIQLRPAIIIIFTCISSKMSSRTPEKIHS